MPTPKNPRPPRKSKWKMWCPVEGIVYYSDQMRQRWDGVWVGPNAELSRHPQEFLQVNPEQPLPYISPPPDDGTTASICSARSTLGIVGLGIVGCSIAGKESIH